MRRVHTAHYTKCLESRSVRRITIPRVVHDVHSVVILVSCQYKCSNGHSILTTDSRILALISDEHILFILLHRVGFTKLFARKVIGLLEEGMSISSIERLNQRQRHLFICETAAQVMQFETVFDRWRSSYPVFKPNTSWNSVSKQWFDKINASFLIFC